MGDSFTRNVMIVIKRLFEKTLLGYSFEIKIMNSNNYIYVIEDSLALLVSFVPNFAAQYESAEAYLREYNMNRYLEEDYSGDEFEHFAIEEITPNQIDFKFDSKGLSKMINTELGEEFQRAYLGYEKFRGYKRVYWCLDRETTAEYVNRIMPELCLRERYDLWCGNPYNFIIYECQAADGTLHYVCDYTITSPQKIVLKTGRGYVKTGHFLTETFEKALMTWKNKRRFQRIEEHLSYYIVRECIREKDDVWRRARQLAELAREHKLIDLEKIPYHTPSNKWVSEESVYLLTKKLYKGFKVIYQHRPFYLKSSIGGQMSYDVFISGLNVAIEYQGKQHFEPVDFFGGRESFEELKKRDREKASISKQNGIKLVYINYWEEITPELIKSRVENADV